MLLALTVHLRSTPAAAQPQDPPVESDTLFYEGNELMARGEALEACKKFEQSLGLARRGGTLLNLALCYEATGKLASSLPLFTESLEAAARDGRTDRQEIAQKHLDALQAKLSWINVVPPEPEITGLEITCDGAALPQTTWGTPIPADAGRHVIVAAAPGRDKFVATVNIVDAGEVRNVDIPALQVIYPQVPTKGTPAAPRDIPPLPLREDELEHSLQLGLITRLDVDPIHPGARGITGLTLGLGEYFEVGASALLGRDAGVEPQLTCFLLGRTAWKPLINVAMPIILTERTSAGVRGAAGLQWDVNRHFGIFGQVGGAYFPDPRLGYVRGVFILSFGVQGRI